MFNLLKNALQILPRLQVAMAATVLLSGELQSASGEELPSSVRRLLAEQCLICHDDATRDGDLSLDLEAVDWSDVQEQTRWEKLHLLVSRGVMPPASEPSLSAGQRHELLGFVRQHLVKHQSIGGTALRRLSRREYQETIRKLFGLGDFQVPNSFPPDPTDGRFDNTAELLSIAPAHMDALVDAAVAVADRIIAPVAAPVASQEVAIPADQLVISYSSACLIDGAMRLASSGKVINRNATWPTKFVAPASGRYQVDLQVSATAQPDGQTPILQVSTMDPSDRSKVSEVQSLPVEPGQQRQFRFEAEMTEGHTLVFQYVNGPFVYDDKAALTKWLQELFRHDPLLAAAWTEVGAPPRGGSGWQRLKATMQQLRSSGQPVDSDETQLRELAKRAASKNVNTGETLVYKYFEEGPYIAIKQVDIAGPVAPALKQNALAAKARYAKFLRDDEIDSDVGLMRFMDRYLSQAFRRPATGAEIQAYVAIVTNEIANGRRPEDGLHLAIRTSLMAPAFLFRSVGVGELDAYGLASRLSYFLTSGPPDTTLISAAKSGRLHNAKVLAAQTRRLAGERLAQDFTRGWLGLDSLDSLMPDSRVIGKFTDQMRRSMIDEVTVTFHEILQANLSARELIAPEFIYTSPTINAEIYGLPQSAGQDKRSGKNRSKPVRLQRVPLESGRFGRVGGLLTMPAVMMATANGVDTQPVLRGVWMLENVLGRPSPEPPNAVPALTPDTSSVSTPRQRLADHMDDDSCAVCHRAIDPVGFVLENLDPIGRWRDHYPVYAEKNGKMVVEDGPVIDASGRLPDGTLLHDVTDLKRWLYENPEPFVCCLAEKLLNYGTGRELNFRQRELVENIVAAQASNDYRFMDLLVALVQSPIFRTK